MSVDTQNLRDWLTLCHAPQVGSATISQLLAHFQSPQEILNAGREALTATGLSEVSINGLLSPDEKAIDDDLEWQVQDQQMY